MNKKITIVASIMVTITVLMCVNMFFGGAGIVALEGYEHGVAFCEKQYSTVIATDSATVWNDGHATYVVNAGHIGDPEVKQLQVLATIECGKY